MDDTILVTAFEENNLGLTINDNTMEWCFHRQIDRAIIYEKSKEIIILMYKAT